MKREDYKKFAQTHAPKSKLIPNCLKAFVFGGLICAVGQGIINISVSLGAEKETASSLCSVILIFITALLTGLGIFDKFATVAMAGALVPITGFANAVAAPAIDTKTEGFVLGVGAKIFIIAGPVILYGISSGVVYGIVYEIVRLIGA